MSGLDTHAYWYVEVGGEPRFVFARGRAAAEVEASSHAIGLVVKPVPYPFGGAHSPDGCPAFCHSPRECAGKTACPQARACTE